MFPLALLWTLMLIRMMKYFQTEDESNNRKFHYKYLLIITNHLPFAFVSPFVFHCISLGLKHSPSVSSEWDFRGVIVMAGIKDSHEKRYTLSTTKLYEWDLMTNIIILLLNLRSKIEKIMPAKILLKIYSANIN